MANSNSTHRHKGTDSQRLSHDDLYDISGIHLTSTQLTDLTDSGETTLHSHSVVDETGGLGVFGDGSTGASTISTDATITADKFYSQLTVNGGILSAGGYKIFCIGTLQVDTGYTINYNGNNGGNGLNATLPNLIGLAGSGAAELPPGTLFGAPVGVDGVSGNYNVENGYNGKDGSPHQHNVLGAIGASGGVGGASNGQTGGIAGLGGSVTASILNPRALPMAGWMIDLPVGTYAAFLKAGGVSGSGGSGGAGSAGISGGSGGVGGNGGIVYIAAKTVVLNGTIEAKGGAGGNAGTSTGGAGADAGGSAGSGGGHGGYIVMVCETISGTGGFNISGGAGGTKSSGFGAGADGTDGVAGANGGTILILTKSY